MAGADRFAPIAAIEPSSPRCSKQAYSDLRLPRILCC